MDCRIVLTFRHSEEATYPRHLCLPHRAVLVDNSLAAHSGGAVTAERACEFKRVRGFPGVLL